MLSLAFVAYDMSKPIILSDKAILVEDVVECIVQPFVSIFDDGSGDVSELPTQGYNFIFNIFLPIVVYIASIGGFLYLLIEDFKLLKTFSHQNKLARYVWSLWIIVLLGLLMIPIFFGMQLLMKGFVLAVIATAIFLISIAILYRLSYKQKTQQKP
jgi:sensor histidine kinase YesM